MASEHVCDAATAAWLLGQPDAAWKDLQRAEKTAPGDRKVRQNALLARYYAATVDEQDPDALVKDLLQLAGPWADLAKDGEAVSDDGSSSGGSGGGAGATAGGTAAEEEDALLRSPAACAVPLVNAAAILAAQQRHASTQRLLAPMFDQAEAVSGGAALRLCLLLFDSYLESGHLAAAAGVLTYLEGALGRASPAAQRAAREALGASSGGGASGGGDGGEQQEGEEEAQGKADGEQQQQQQGEQEAQEPPPQQEQQQQAEPAPVDPRTALRLPQVSRVTCQAMDRVRARLEKGTSTTTTSTTNGSAAKGEAAAAAASAGGSGVPSSSGLGDSVPDAKLLLHLLRTRLALAAGRPRAAKRDVRALLSALPQSAQVLALKAQLDAARGHPRKALRALGPLLAPPSAEVTGPAGSAEGDGSSSSVLACPASRVPLLNDLGVLHHQFGKHQLAAIYLSKALSEASAAQPGRRAPVATAAAAASTAAKPAAAAAAKPGKAAAAGGKAAKGAASGGGSKSGVGSGGKDAAVAAAAAPQPPQGLWADHRHAILYNLGLQHLMLGNWAAALDCLTAAGERFYRQPALWLRLGEANVGLHCEGAETRRRQQQQQQQQQQQDVPNGQEKQQQQEGGAGSGGLEAAELHPLLAGAAGRGERRRLLLPAGHLCGWDEGDGAAWWAAAGEQTETARAAEGPLGAAILQLETAIALVAVLKSEAQSAAASREANSGGLLDASGATPHSPPCLRAGSDDGSGDGRRSSGGGGGGASGGGEGGQAGSGSYVLTDVPPPEQLDPIEQAALANLAYAHLLRGAPGPALEAAEKLLAVGATLPPASRHLGASYAAEALCALGRPADAAHCLRTHLEALTAAEAEGGSAAAAAGAPGEDDGPSGGSSGGGAAAAAPLGCAPAAAALVGAPARAAALCDLASVAAMREQLPEAYALAQQALATAAADDGAAAAGFVAAAAPAGRRGEGGIAAVAGAARLLLVYCELKAGNPAAAVALLRDDR